MVEPGRVIALEGPSGAGKSTLARALARAGGWVFLAEAYDRLDPPPNLRFESAGELIRIERALLAEERRRYRESVRRKERGETVIADTGFLGPLTYTAGLVARGEAPVRAFEVVRRLSGLRTGQAEGLGVPDLVIYLDAPTEARRQRASRDALRHPREFRLRHEAVGRVERRFYRDLARHFGPGRVRFIRSAGPSRALAARLRPLVRVRPSPSAEPLSVADLAARLARIVRDERRRRRRRIIRHR